MTDYVKSNSSEMKKCMFQAWAKNWAAVVPRRRQKTKWNMEMIMGCSATEEKKIIVKDYWLDAK